MQGLLGGQTQVPAHMQKVRHLPNQARVTDVVPDLFSLLHPRKGGEVREMPLMPIKQVNQIKDRPGVQAMYDEAGADYSSSPCANFCLGQVDSICIKCYFNGSACNHHVHKLYFIEPRYIHSNGYSEMCRYSGRWYEVKCRYCEGKKSYYRRKRRSYNR